MPDRSTPATERSWKLRAGALAMGTAAGMAALFGVTTLSGGSPASSPVSLAGAVGESGEDLSGPCDEPEHASDPECGAPGDPTDDSGHDDGTSTTSSTAPSTAGTNPTTAPDPGGTPIGEVRTIDAAGAGTVVVALEAGGLRIVSATPTAGWSVEIEADAGREVEVDFRSGTRRVQVDVELEDGQVRERVRFRDDATDADVRTEDGTVVRDDHADDDRDHDEEGDDDRSGPGGHGRDHPEDD